MLPGEFIDTTPEPMELQLGDRGSLPPPGYGFIENSDGNRTYFSPQPQKAAPAKARKRTARAPTPRPSRRDWLNPSQDAPSVPVQFSPGRSTALPRGFAIPQGPGAVRTPLTEDPEKAWLGTYGQLERQVYSQRNRRMFGPGRHPLAHRRLARWKSYGKKRGFI